MLPMIMNMNIVMGGMLNGKLSTAAKEILEKFSGQMENEIESIYRNMAKATWAASDKLGLYNSSSKKKLDSKSQIEERMEYAKRMFVLETLGIEERSVLESAIDTRLGQSFRC